MGPLYCAKKNWPPGSLQAKAVYTLIIDAIRVDEIAKIGALQSFSFLNSYRMETVIGTTFTILRRPLRDQFF